MIRTLILILALGAATVEAHACLGRVGEMSIFYSEVPEQIDASAVVEVTIVGLSPANADGYFVGIGKVEKVIKGNIDRDTIKVLTAISDCLPMFPIGAHGMVIGDLRRTEKGEIEILAIAEPLYLRRSRKEIDKGR